MGGVDPLNLTYIFNVNTKNGHNFKLGPPPFSKAHGFWKLLYRFPTFFVEVVCLFVSRLLTAGCCKLRNSGVREVPQLPKDIGAGSKKKENNLKNTTKMHCYTVTH